MPLVTLCGRPACGKTRFAEGFVAFLESTQDKRVVLVNEESLHVTKADGYRDATAEKQTRGGLKAGVDHAVNAKTIVVLDSMNYIKGFRYELYCSARSESTQHCVVWVECEQEVARAWNAGREDAYPPELFEDLWSRFETPDERNRWDKPLIRCQAVAAGGGGTGPECEASPYAAVYAEVLEALTSGKATPAGMSTSSSRHAEPDVLYQLEALTNRAVSFIVDWQATPGHSSTVQLPFGSKPLELTRRLGLYEAYRLRRQFVKQVSVLGSSSVMEAQQGPDRERAIADAFVEYLHSSIS